LKNELLAISTVLMALSLSCITFVNAVTAVEASDLIKTFIADKDSMLGNMKNMSVPLGGNVDSLKGINPGNTYA
jgi:hypothetical protein